MPEVCYAGGSCHDAYVRWNLNNLEMARLFFEKFLEPELIQTLNLSLLRPGKTDVVDDALTEIRSDLLFHAPFNSRSFDLALLIEHKSQGGLDQRYQTLPFQLRRNEMRIMEELRRHQMSGLYPAVHALGLIPAKGLTGGL